MKLIIAGGRDLTVGRALIEEIINQSGFFVTEVVSGACGRPDDEIFPETMDMFANGIDGCGEKWALLNEDWTEGALLGELITLKRFNAQWTEQGKAAGPRRNKQMAKYADALLLIWDGESSGSMSMKREMRMAGKPIIEVVLPS